MADPIELDGKFNPATGNYECSPAVLKAGEREINITIMDIDDSFPKKIRITKEWQEQLNKLGGWAP